MSLSSSDPASRNPDASTNKVDITFVVASWKSALTGDRWCYTRALEDAGITSRSFTGINKPRWFQTETIQGLTEHTQIMVIDCMNESSDSDKFHENRWLTAWLKLAEAVRAVHASLPIWLLDPIADKDGIYSVEERINEWGIDAVSFFDTPPSKFAEKVKMLLWKKS